MVLLCALTALPWFGGVQEAACSTRARLHVGGHINQTSSGPQTTLRHPRATRVVLKTINHK